MTELADAPEVMTALTDPFKKNAEQVESAPIASDGSLGLWADLGTVPTIITSGESPKTAAVVSRGYVFVLTANYTPLVARAV